MISIPKDTEKEDEDDEKGKKKSSTSKGKRSVKSYISEASDEVFEFMKEQAEKGEIIKDPQDVFKYHREPLLKYLDKKHKWSLLAHLEEHLGRKVQYNDISKTLVKWWLIFEHAWRERLIESLDAEKNKTYYELLVKKYGDWFDGVAGTSGMWGKWKDFLNTHKPRLAVTADQFTNLVWWKDKGKVKYTKNIYRDLVDAFHAFCKKHDISGKDQKKITDGATITNGDLIDIFKEKKLFGKEMEWLINGKITFKKNEKKASKKDLDREVDFRQTQEALVSIDVEDTMTHHAESILESRKNFIDLMKQRWFANKICSEPWYGIEDFKKATRREESEYGTWMYSANPMRKIMEAKKPWTWIKWRKEQLIEMKEMKSHLLIEDDADTRDVLRSTIQDIEENTRDDGIVYIDNAVAQHQGFIDDYLQRLQQWSNNPQRTSYAKILEENNQDLHALTWERTTEWPIGNIQATKDIMNYIVRSRMETYVDKAPDILGDIATSYGLENHKEQYTKFWQDIYDPDQMTVEFPPIDGERVALRFKRKGLRAKHDSLHDFLYAPSNEENNLFEPILEIDIENSTIPGLEIGLAHTAGKMDAISTFPGKWPNGSNLVLQGDTEYILSMEYKGDTVKHGAYYYKRVYDEEKNVVVDLFFPPDLYKEYEKKDTLFTTQMALSDDRVKVMTSEDIWKFKYTRTKGILIDKPNQIELLNWAYITNEQERAKFVKEKGRSAASLGNYNDPEVTASIGKYTKGLWTTDNEPPVWSTNEWNQTSEKWESGDADFLKHIWFSDTPPHERGKEYLFEREGEVIAWLEEGKVMIHAEHLEKAFGFKFKRSPAGDVDFPTRFHPSGDKNDGHGRRSFRHMFGSYIFHTENDAWKIDPSADWLRDRSIQNTHDQSFIPYLRSLVIHEKCHRFLEFYNIREIEIEQENITLDQEILSEIAERYTCPKDKQSSWKDKTWDVKNTLTAREQNGLDDILNGSSPYRVVGFDPSNENKQHVILQLKWSKKHYKVDITHIESQIWASLFDQNPDHKTYLETLKQKCDGKFFEVVQKLDSFNIANITKLVKEGKNPFEDLYMTATMWEIDRPMAVERDEVESNPDVFYVHSDNEADFWKSLGDRPGRTWTSLNKLWWLPNSLPVPTAHDYVNSFVDWDLEENKKKIDKYIEKVREKLREWKKIVIPYDSALKRYNVWRQLSEETESTQTYNYLQDELDKIYKESIGEYTPDTATTATTDEGGEDEHIDTSWTTVAEQAFTDTAVEDAGPVEWSTTWSKMWGDGNASIDDNPAILFRSEQSKLQGFWSVWLKGQLKKKGGGYEIVLQDSSEGDLSSLGAQWMKIDLPTPEALQQIYRKTRQWMYKLKNLDWPGDFVKYMTWWLESDDSFINNGMIRRQPKYMSEKWGKIMRTYNVGEEEKTAPLAYIGKTLDRWSHDWHPEDSVFQFYKVTQHDDGVTVEAITGEYKFKKKMDRSTFAMFMVDKNMDPFTEDEYTAQKEDTHEQYKWVDGSIWDRFMSINSIIAAAKKFPEAWKHRVEQDEKFQSSRLYQQIAETFLPDISYLGDIKADADSELDTNILQVIEWYKDRLSRKDGGDSTWVHGNRACERIEREIFDHPRGTLAYKHRAAGYLLYMIEEEGNPYSRNLAKYAGEWAWIKVLLWAEQQREFIKWRKYKQDELKNKWFEDEEWFDDYVMMEMLFLQERCDDQAFVRKIFGSRFPKRIERGIEYIGSEKRVSEVREGIDAKWSIYAIVNEANSKMKKLQSAKAFATLDNLAQRAEEPHHYLAFYKVLMQMMVSGVCCYTYSNHIKAKMKQIGRTFGIPFCVMVKDIHHPLRTVRILDNIAKNKWIPSVTKFIQDQDGVPNDRDISDQTHTNFSHENRHRKVIDAVGEWRNKYGYTAMDSLNNMDRNMILNSEDKTWNSKKKKEIETSQEYYDRKLFDKERNKETAMNKDAFKAVLNPLFSNGILNLQQPTFKALLRNRDATGGQSWQFDTNARELWKHMKNKVDDYGRDLSSLKYSSDPKDKKVYKARLKILFRKFAEYFKEEFRDEEREKIAWFFKSKSITEEDSTRDSVYGVFSQHLFARSLQDGVAQRTIKSFFDVFAEHKDILSENDWLIKEFGSLEPEAKVVEIESEAKVVPMEQPSTVKSKAA